MDITIMTMFNCFTEAQAGTVFLVAVMLGFIVAPIFTSIAFKKD